jgi:hypothetical protein
MSISSVACGPRRACGSAPRGGAERRRAAASRPRSGSGSGTRRASDITDHDQRGSTPVRDRARSSRPTASRCTSPSRRGAAGLAPARLPRIVLLLAPPARRLASAGFHAVAPDRRGYGQTTPHRGGAAPAVRAHARITRHRLFAPTGQSPGPSSRPVASPIDALGGYYT